MVRKSIRLLIAASSPMVSGILVFAAAAQPAHAADLPVRPSAVVEAYGWSGCYAGANAGWIGGADRIDAYPGPTVGPAPLTPAELALVTNRHSSQDSSGFTGGAQAGCSWQRAGSPFVFGVEADFNGTGLRESSTTAYPLVAVNAIVDIPSHLEVVTKKLDWFSTIRARLGFAHDRWLAYVTGGLAVTRIDSSLDWINDGSSILVASDSRTRFGWTAGGGLEYAFAANWSAKVEYLYLDFGKFTFDVPHVSVDQSWKVDVNAREHVLRVGLNYRFGGPLIARN